MCVRCRPAFGRGAVVMWPAYLFCTVWFHHDDADELFETRFGWMYLRYRAEMWCAALCLLHAEQLMSLFMVTTQSHVNVAVTTLCILFKLI